MSGYTKHEYEKYIQETKISLGKYIKAISITLPEVYGAQDIIPAIEKYYPYEWRMINERYAEYAKADIKLLKFNKKRRYNMPSPYRILMCTANTTKPFTFSSTQA
ncbi:MAG: hypothetical protein Q4B85_12190 [Lachnospiraceae bacterium]|nr:hypothetical protein [Lachnospiraceae bacterium]